MPTKSAKKTTSIGRHSTTKKRTSSSKTPSKNIKHFVSGQYVAATGRRKRAIARVKIWDKKGSIIINDIPADKYFPLFTHQVRYQEPLRVTNTLGKVTIRVTVKGSGPTGQVGAVIHGIARCLIKLDQADHKSILKKYGYLTRDSRKKERRKVGTGGKARRQKQSPKR